MTKLSALVLGVFAIQASACDMEEALDEGALEAGDGGAVSTDAPLSVEEAELRGLPIDDGQVWWDGGVETVAREMIDGDGKPIAGLVDRLAPAISCYVHYGIWTSGSSVVGSTIRECNATGSNTATNRLYRNGALVAYASKTCWSWYCEVRTYASNPAGSQRFCSGSLCRYY